MDRIVTSRVWGFPLMIALFTLMFWLTISGANVPSGMIANLLIDQFYPVLREGATQLGFVVVARRLDRRHLSGVRGHQRDAAADGNFLPDVYAARDFGYLPRVAFNLDRMFKTPAPTASKP